MAKDVTITIDMVKDSTGNERPTVSWPTGDDCSQGNDNKPCCHRNHRVEWKPADAVKDRVWAVVFAEGSPFKHDQAVFSPSSPKGQVKGTPAEKNYKYWVTMADENNELVWEDPRIMISEPSPAPDDDTTYLMMASELEEFAHTSEELAHQAREVAEGLRSLSLPDDDPHGTAA